MLTTSIIVFYSIVTLAILLFIYIKHIEFRHLMLIIEAKDAVILEHLKLIKSLSKRQQNINVTDGDININHEDNRR